MPSMAGPLVDGLGDAAVARDNRIRAMVATEALELDAARLALATRADDLDAHGDHREGDDDRLDDKQMVLHVRDGLAQDEAEHGDAHRPQEPTEHVESRERAQVHAAHASHGA